MVITVLVFHRAKALQLCGWSYDLSVLNNALDALEADGEFSRAAAIALFNLQILRAIDTLNRGAEKLQGTNPVEVNCAGENSMGKRERERERERWLLTIRLGAEKLS